MPMKDHRQLIGSNLRPGMVAGGFSKPLATCRNNNRLPQRKKMSFEQVAVEVRKRRVGERTEEIRDFLSVIARSTE